MSKPDSELRGGMPWDCHLSENCIHEFLLIATSAHTPCLSSDHRRHGGPASHVLSRHRDWLWRPCIRCHIPLFWCRSEAIAEETGALGEVTEPVMPGISAANCSVVCLETPEQQRTPPAFLGRRTPAGPGCPAMTSSFELSGDLLSAACRNLTEAVDNPQKRPR